MPDKIRVLFVCTTNAGSSQMAEAILNDMAPERFEAFSAGIAPVEVHPMAEEAMRHVNIDLSHADSKPITAFAGQSFDLAITIGDVDVDWTKFICIERLHWAISDPLLERGHMEDIIQAFLSARHDIYQHVQGLVNSIGHQS